MIKVEKDIPIPNKIKNLNEKLPVLELEIGESFYVEGNKDVIGSVRASVMYFGNKVGKRFTTRSFRDDTKLIGVRVWRTE